MFVYGLTHQNELIIIITLIAEPNNLVEMQVRTYQIGYFTIQHKK